MKIQLIEHVPFEGPGSIANWAGAEGYQLGISRIYARQQSGAELPELSSIDALIVMGGPMGVYDEQQYPWLSLEKSYIREAIAANLPVLGICLGAQLIAAALGAKVYPNREKEIGWFSIEPVDGQSSSPFSPYFDTEQTVFHWHGDTFELPSGAIHLAQSKACKHQAFSIGNNVLALQFHLEATRPSVTKLIEHCQNELEQGGEFVQSAEQMLATDAPFEQNNSTMAGLLTQLLSSQDI